jgi:hypothetical protein
MRFAFPILLFSVLAASAQLPNDPYYQLLTLATNDSLIHGTKIIRGASGSNYLAATTRPNSGTNGARVMLFDVNNISNYNTLEFGTNKHAYAPECVVISNKLYVLMVGERGSSVASNYWTITQIDPDTLATNDLFESTDFNCSLLGTIGTDGTNLYVLDGEYSVGKWSTDGTQLGSNYLGVANAGFPLCNWIWKGQIGHGIWWDGTDFLITGNSSMCTNTSMIVMAPDLTFTQHALRGRAFTNGEVLKLTDDLCAVNGWAAVGTEFDILGRVHLFNKTTGAHAAVQTDRADSGICYGTFADPPYIWATWYLGFLTRIDTRTIDNGVVRAQTFTLGEIRPGFNELAHYTNGTTRVYFATSWDTPTQVFRFSEPQLFSTQASYTNGVLVNNPTLLTVR